MRCFPLCVPTFISLMHSTHESNFSPNARSHIGFLAFLSVVAVVKAATPQYTIVDLGSLGGTTPQAYAYGINNAGTVVGWSSTPTSARGFTYRNGVMTALGTLSGASSPYSKAYGINEAGIVVGTSTVSYGTHAVSFSSGTVNDLGSLGGKDAQANAINSAGTIVGNSQIANGNVHAFSYSNGVMTDLGTLGGAHSQAYGINDTGVIVGSSKTASNDSHAFSYSGGVMTDLGTFSGTTSEARFITNDSTIGGGFGTPTGGGGFILSNGMMTGIASGGSVYDINTARVVVGAGTFNYGPVCAIRYSIGLTTDLNTVIPAPAPTSLTSAKGINDAGMIIANGANYHAYLLTPIPAPGSYAAWVAQNSLTGKSADADAVLTNDDVTNLMKYALGLPAMQSAVPSLPDATFESGQLIFRFTQPLILSGVSTIVQTSTDLVHWVTAAEAPLIESTTETTQTLKVVFTPGRANLYVRLCVTLP